MKLRPALIEMVVSDMAATLAFYRRLGLEIPEAADDEPHVDIELVGGMRLAGILRTPSGPSIPGGQLQLAGIEPMLPSPVRARPRLTQPGLNSLKPATRAISNRGMRFGVCAMPLSTTPMVDRLTSLLRCRPRRGHQAILWGSFQPRHVPPGRGAPGRRSHLPRPLGPEVHRSELLPRHAGTE
jgi:hypothetical protein